MKKTKLWLLEFRYHKRVMNFLTFKEKLSYIVKQVIQRECVKRDFCLSSASLRRLSTQHSDEILNYAFHCENCHQQTEKALAQYYAEYTPEEVGEVEPNVDMEEIQRLVEEEKGTDNQKVASTEKITRRSAKTNKGDDAHDDMGRIQALPETKRVLGKTTQRKSARPIKSD